MKPTIPQLNFIKTIEEFVSCEFTGKTKEEARQYIYDNIDEFKVKSADNFVIENGYF